MFLVSEKTPLWEQAFDALSDDDKQDLKTTETDTDPQPQDIVQALEIKRQECVRKQWVLYTNKAGEKVLFRDMLGKLVNWVERFQQVGNTAVQYDPGHAAIPWMVVRALLNVVVNDIQTFGAMVESLETISSIIARYTELEAKVLIRESNLTSQLSAALVTLYGSTLAFLAHAWRYYGQRTIKRLLHSAIGSTKSVVEEPMLRIEKHEEQVYRLVSLVQTEITGVKLDSIIEGIRQSVESSHATNEERRKRLSSWINGIDTKNTYETALQYHHNGTCDWALHMAEFQKWQSPDSQDPKLLWLHGPAGFGKTFMSAWIIQYLEKVKTSPLSYFFCVADNQITRDPYAILRSWLTQMLDQDEDVVLAMDAVYKVRSKEQTLTYLGLWEIFTAIGAHVHGCTFVIDGFDECADIDTGARYHRSDPRNMFLRDLLNNLANTSSRVLIVSRDVPDIREYLGQNMSTAGSSPGGVNKFEYSITAKDTAEDVRLFSEHMVNTKLVKKSAQLRQKISTQAAERSEGMFLWIKLLEQEISPGKNAKQLAEVVAEMPLGIGEAYSRELDKILRLSSDVKDRAVMILRWTLFAVRPLQVKQLAEALVVSDQDLDEYPQDDLPDSWNDGFVDEDYVKEMILSPCGSLLQLRSNNPDTALAEHTVHFVHFSVKEYLLNLSTENITSAGAGQEPTAASLGLANASNEERRLSNICLRYLTLDTFEKIPTDMSVYPFLSYAAWAWYFHSFHEKPTPSQDILDRTQKAFDPSVSSWRVWTPLMEAEVTASAESGSFSDSDSEIWSDTASEGTEDDTSPLTAISPTTTVLTPIYYASLLGLTDVVKWLEGQGLDFESAGGRFGFPLQAAVVNGHMDVVRYLLSRKVNVLQKGGEFGAAIIAAAASSTAEIVKMLLAAGADAKVSAPESGWTALHYAAKRGSVEITRLLLDSGAEVNAMSTTELTATNLACWFDHADVLILLSDKGADLNHADNDSEFGGAPLEAAIVNGNISMVSMLLDRGVFPNQLFPGGYSALHTAIRYGEPDIIKRLLEKGADPNITENRKNGALPLPKDSIEEKREKYWTPLHAAASLGEVDYIAVLVDAGAAVRGRHPQASSPLQVAVANDHLEAAKFLYLHGAELDQEPEGGLTSLLIAVNAEALATANWLLDVGASMRGIWENTQQSLFDLVADGSSTDIAELLVRRGFFRIQIPETSSAISDVDPPSPLEWDEDSLVMLAYTGNADKLSKVLLANQQDQGHLSPGYLGEALHVASALGHVEVVKLLLSNPGSYVNLRDINSRTALHHATRNCRFDLAELLVDKGANVSLGDIIGSTPIDLAIANGKRANSFIQRNMDNLTFNINHRPSLLQSPAANRVSATTVRKSISGSWTGHYQYLSWEQGRQDPFDINFPASPFAGGQPSTFSSDDGEDTIGAFHFHGFVDPIGIVWFVKLYENLGWLYRGQLTEVMDVEGSGGGKEAGGNTTGFVLKGTWGSNRKLWFGTFLLKKVVEGK